MLFSKKSKTSFHYFKVIKWTRNFNKETQRTLKILSKIKKPANKLQRASHQAPMVDLCLRTSGQLNDRNFSLLN